MKVLHKVGLTVNALLFSLFLTFSFGNATAVATWQSEYLVAWFPVVTFADQTSHQPTDALSINSQARLSLTNGSSAINVAHGSIGTLKTSHVYASNSGWNSNEKWWLLSSLSSSGYEDLSFSFVMRSSNTGPRDFVVQYSLNGINWIVLNDGTDEVNIKSANTFQRFGPYSLPEELNNCPEFYLRIYKNSNVSAEGNAVSSQGTNAITEISIKGKPIIVEERTILANWNISLQEANENHDYYAKNTAATPHFRAATGLYADEATFWVIKKSGTDQNLKASNTSFVSGNALHNDGLRYQGLEQGAFWLLEFASTGYENLVFEWQQRCSPTAPANYQLQYSLNYDPSKSPANQNADWYDIGEPTIIIQDAAIGSPRSRFSQELPALLANQERFYLRLLVTSNDEVGGVYGSDTTNGVFSINFIYLSGEPIKEVILPQLPQVNTNTDGGTKISGDGKIELNITAEQALIYYRINEGERQLYNGQAISLNAAMFVGEPPKMTLSVWAEKKDYQNSEINVFEYYLLNENNKEEEAKELETLPKVRSSLTSGWIKVGTTFNLYNDVLDTTIYYRINNSEILVYQDVITITKEMLLSDSDKVTLRTWAEKENYNRSEENVYVYQLERTVNSPKTSDTVIWPLVLLMVVMLLLAIPLVKELFGKDKYSNWY